MNDILLGVTIGILIFFVYVFIYRTFVAHRNGRRVFYIGYDIKEFNRAYFAIILRNDDE